MAITSIPVITAQLLAANGLVGPNPFRTLICGQIGTDGSAISGAAYQELQNMTTAQIIALFGTKSEMTNRLIRHLSVMNGLVSVWAVGLTAGAGTAATFAMAIVGTATQAGTITLKLIDAYNFTIQISVAVGDTAAVIAGNINTAILALGSLFPATTNVVSGTITFTANDVGTLGNKYTIGLVGQIPAGISALPVGQFSSGATDPTLTNIFANVASTRFHSISWPWQTAFATVKNFLESRNVINNAFLHGIAFIGLDDTESNIHTALNGVTPVNSPNLVFMGNKAVGGVSQIITPSDWRAVEFMAIEALRMTQNAPISQYLSSTAPNDQYGGPALASLPLFNTPLAKTDIADPSLLFSQTEQNACVVDGFTVVGVNSSRSMMIMGTVVTTYKTNVQGQVDPSFKYLEYVRTGFMALEIVFNTQKSDYAQTRLTQGDLQAGFSMANQASITAELLGIYRTLSTTFPLLQAGKAAESNFLNKLIVSLNLATGTVTETGVFTIVTQLRTINQTFQLAYTL